MKALHFMPESSAELQGKSELDGNDVALGAERVLAALDMVHPGKSKWGEWSAGRKIGKTVTNGFYRDERGAVSFLAAAMICRKASFPKLTGRFAHCEALYATHVIDDIFRNVAPRGWKDTAAAVRNDVCREVLGTALKVVPGRNGPSYTIPVPQYLKFCVGMGRSWKLVNQTVHAGMVHMDRDRLVRLLRDAITSYIRERIVKMPDPPVEVPPEIAEWCSKFTEAGTGGDTPPCVEQCRGVMDGGKNLGHNGRFLVGSFYIHGGLDDDSIAAMFEGAPDYNPRITKYHVGQIRRRGYSVPSCRWVESNGLCPGCDAPHPTKYRKPE